MSAYSNLILKSEEIEEKIHYVFHNKDLLALAFVHRSFYNEHRQEVKQHNERLEFLGDSVLGLLVAEYLYAQDPEGSEGRLSHQRSHLVEAATCAFFLQKLEIAEFVLLGRGEKMSEGKSKESIQADLFEALIGAIYLDGGLDAAKNFFWFHFQREVEEKIRGEIRNWKAELQDFCQKKWQKPPVYRVVKEIGPDHLKQFEVEVSLEEIFGKGVGSSKKEAEQQAAEEAIKNMEKEKYGKRKGDLGV